MNKAQYNKKYWAGHKDERKVHRHVLYVRNKEKERDTFLKQHYGITLAEYNVLLQVQNNLCAICSKPYHATLHVDHDHKTGRIRGLLCKNCNIMLGASLDIPSVLKRGADYLEQYKPQ
jgi:hypothetical protein